MSQTEIRFNGNIISELSDKIPTYLVAFNELIKNAYDACAQNVEIRLDSSKFIIEVVDDGKGMSQEDINNLFHISKSTKTYGEKHTCDFDNDKIERYNQGSKGLGFLSVYKFGYNVKWRTVRNKVVRSFSADYNELISMTDLSHFPINVSEESLEDTNDIGTIIEIKTNERGFNDILQYLNDKKNSNKIVNAFTDQSINIVYKLDNKEMAKTSKQMVTSDNLLFNVKYDSKKQMIELYYNNKLLDQQTFPVADTRFNLVLDLNIYEFTLDRTGKSKIDDLFKVGNKLYPLLFINNNYFDNNTLFDPENTRSLRNTQTLAQITGYVKIYCHDKLMGFNSDRTNFIQNELTDKIEDVLRKINIEIQKFASAKKRYLLDFNILDNFSFDKTIEEITDEEIKANIKNDFTYKDKVTFRRDADNKIIIYSFLGKERKCSSLLKKNKKEISAYIELKTKHERKIINSNQTDLSDYISVAMNSSNEDVKKDVKVIINNSILDSKVLPSQSEAKNIIVIFEYVDIKTGPTRETLELEFYENTSSVVGVVTEDYLVSIPGDHKYVFNYNNPLKRLVDQINKLAKDFDNNKEIIATSLRSIFDISIETIIISRKIDTYVKRSNDLITNVKKLIEWARTQKKQLQTNTNINENTLSNLLDASDYETYVRKTHLAAHASTWFISEDEVKNIAKKSGLIIMLTNEVINYF
jgi:hypothetical protein